MQVPMLRLHDFARDWRIERRIDDRLSGRPGRFDGEARLVPAAEGFLYREKGTLTFADGLPLVAHRDYLWRQVGEEIEVRFPDRRPFHRFVPEGRAPGTDHTCGRDFYRVTYDFSAWPLWTATWSVSGPVKDYVLRSSYRPQ